MAEENPAVRSTGMWCQAANCELFTLLSRTKVLVQHGGASVRGEVARRENAANCQPEILKQTSRGLGKNP
jgi:hypothetical protein